jgi:hypothetical protein
MSPTPIGDEQVREKREAAPGLAAQPRPRRALPPFPERVGGFTFGMTVDQAQAACAIPEQRRLARDGYRYFTNLYVEGARGSCLFAPEPLDFVDRVQVYFAAGQVVRIALIPTSYEIARERLFAKYGTPLGCIIGGETLRWNAEVERNAQECVWLLDGGRLSLSSEREPFARVLYISDAEDELKTQGY